MIIKEEYSSRNGEMGNIHLNVTDSNGISIETQTIPFRSFVAQFWIIFRQWSRGFNFSARRLDDLGFVTVSQTQSLPRVLMVNPDTYGGIIVGSGAAPYSIEQNTLDNIIQAGTGPNELNYLEGFTNYSETDVNKRITTLSRTFSNTSAASITVRELGVGASRELGADLTNTFLIARDVLPSEIVIPNDGALTVTYELFFTQGVRAFDAILEGLGNASNTSITRVNTLGSTVAINSTAAWRLNDDGANEPHTLRIGSGSTPVNFTDFRLEDLIPIGTGDGEVQATSRIVSLVNVDELNQELSFTIERTFYNAGSIPININEVGLRCRSGFANRSFLTSRHVLPETVVLGVGESRTVTWLFKYTA